MADAPAERDEPDSDDEALSTPSLQALSARAEELQAQILQRNEQVCRDGVPRPLTCETLALNSTRIAARVRSSGRCSSFATRCCSRMRS